ncbi:MAG: hypothetical protein AAGE37_11535 [Pseudomonadota bacterium]
MNKFPTELLAPKVGKIGPHPLDGHFIRVPLMAFQLNDEKVDTALRWDFVEFVEHDLLDLPGRVIEYERGDVDASIYIQHAHHPIDVWSITFGQISDQMIFAEFESLIDFEHEGLDDFQSTEWNFTCQLQWTNKVQQA